MSAEEHVLSEIFEDLPCGLRKPIGIDRRDDVECSAVASVGPAVMEPSFGWWSCRGSPAASRQGRPSRSAVYWFRSDAPPRQTGTGL
jgi:hypothetical protein